VEDWWSYREFNFSREQIIWAISHLEELERGDWPVEHVESGYTELGIQKPGVRAEASYIKPEIIAAEIRVRLKTTREAGEALIDEINNGITYYELLCGPAQRALNYISSGHERRQETYAKWKYDQNRIRY
jgi:hypothetical protein